MGQVAAVAQVIGAVASVVGFFNQQNARSDQEEALKKQEQAANEAAQARRQELAAQKQRADIENMRSIRGAIRQQRAAEAGIIARGAVTGTSASSGVAGGVSGVGSQLAANLGYMSDVADTQTASMAAAQRGGEAQLAAGQANIAMAQASADYQSATQMMNMGGTIFSAGGGTTSGKSIFS
jgi:hypothetical protein